MNDEEMIEICEMIKAADEHGIMPEVIRSFHAAASDGGSIIESCRIALSEWDL